MSFNVLIYILLMVFGYHTGRIFGFQSGVESVEFDRARANQSLQQCLKIIRHE